MLPVIKPAQHRVLADALSRKRCPKCNAYGKITANRSLAAACMHCGIGIKLTVDFYETVMSRRKWAVKISKIEEKVQ